MPALQSHDHLTSILGKRQIKSNEFTDRVSKNTVEKQSTNNSKCFKTVQCNTDLFGNGGGRWGGGEARRGWGQVGIMSKF